MRFTLELDESERQALLMALAHLSVERPGWNDMLNRIAVRIDNVESGRARMYDEFRKLYAAAFVAHNSATTVLKTREGKPK